MLMHQIEYVLRNSDGQKYIFIRVHESVGLTDLDVLLEETEFLARKDLQATAVVLAGTSKQVNNVAKGEINEEALFVSLLQT